VRERRIEFKPGVVAGQEKLMNQAHFISRNLSDSELRRFAAEGYLVCGATLSPSGLKQIREECMAAWNREKAAFDPDKTWLENALLPNIHHRSAMVRQFYFAGPLVDVAEQIIGPNLKAATSQLTFKTRSNRMVFPWHQDNGYGELEPYNALSCLTALDDTNLENGCLWVIPGSNRTGQQAHARGKALADAGRGAELTARAEESKAVPVPMKAGESLVMSCWTLHKSGPNRSGRDRRILFFRYADADAVEVYNQRRPRLGRLLRGRTRFEEVRQFEADL